MFKRQISKAHYTTIKNELIYWQQHEWLDNEQVSGILDLYEIEQGISFLRVILVTGAVLVGLGILSFIASNWQEISKLLRFIIIIIHAPYAGLPERFLSPDGKAMVCSAGDTASLLVQQVSGQFAAAWH